MAETVIETLAPCTRFVLRAAAGPAARLSDAFGVVLPPPMLTAADGGNRAALRLGPDEILLLAEDGVAASLGKALDGETVALIDISHGQVALRITGPHAADLLGEYCPLDLDPTAFPPGACTRTLFGKAETVLWCIAANGFRLEVARSFAAYVRALLDEAAADLCE
jgi:sarcosine oxidase subunit gamma